MLAKYFSEVDESHLDPIISEVQSLIVGFIQSQPDAWAPIISSVRLSFLVYFINV